MFKAIVGLLTIGIIVCVLLVLSALTKRHPVELLFIVIMLVCVVMATIGGCIDIGGFVINLVN